MARKSTAAPATPPGKATGIRKSVRQSGAQVSRQSSAPAAKPSATDPIPAVLGRAQDMGLLTAGTQHVGARLPTRLLEQAKKRTGITSTTDLLAFALANVAVEDGFATAFIAARGSLDPDLDVGF